MNADNLIGLLHGLARHTPELPGALCRNNIGLFDSERPADVAASIALCERCPALRRCADWADSVDPRYLGGTVGGRHYPSTRRNPAPSAAGRAPRR
ncbi:MULTISPECIES: WhiB family transcriptional regulator [Mycolicibacterium]|jgi:hypothetical protein|uniref:WhiB family transcriptional regulator n=1 Tax=Mycolicibacterium TaxID=1866885 RepID=UPI00298C52D6|nr:WhiB family transcriptional regulator [Mycolicibacterium sp. D5.8-2]MDW5610010.1 WhiB family transcriptional regulator [Mycolicibacterium sp. D5.8-2]